MEEKSVLVSEQTKNISEEINKLLENKLGDKFFYYSIAYKDFNFKEKIAINIACSNERIDGIRCSAPQLVSLDLDVDSMILKPQKPFGNFGGQYIYRLPNKDVESEKNITMQEIKIPFRNPTRKKHDILRCIEVFCENYIKILKKYKSVLMYQELVNYNEILK